jgi:hypothetical protein
MVYNGFCGYEVSGFPIVGRVPYIFELGTELYPVSGQLTDFVKL